MAGGVRVWRVSRRVNSPRRDRPSLVRYAPAAAVGNGRVELHAFDERGDVVIGSTPHVGPEDAPFDRLLAQDGDYLATSTMYPFVVDLKRKGPVEGLGSHSTGQSSGGGIEALNNVESLKIVVRAAFKGEARRGRPRVSQLPH